jgi:hypothetical protein
MAVGAVAMAGSVVFGIGSPDAPTTRLVDMVWILGIVLWLIVLATGGGLLLGRRMRALMNDERAAGIRIRALSIGFITVNLVALALFAFAARMDLGLQDGVRLITVAGLTAALLSAAWLETR